MQQSCSSSTTKYTVKWNVIIWYRIHITVDDVYLLYGAGILLACTAKIKKLDNLHTSPKASKTLCSSETYTRQNAFQNKETKPHTPGHLQRICLHILHSKNGGLLIQINGH